MLPAAQLTHQMQGRLRVRIPAKRRDDHCHRRYLQLWNAADNHSGVPHLDILSRFRVDLSRYSERPLTVQGATTSRSTLRPIEEHVVNGRPRTQPYLLRQQSTLPGLFFYAAVNVPRPQRSQYPIGQAWRVPVPARPSIGSLLL
jgi:hypothetical protein